MGGIEQFLSHSRESYRYDLDGGGWTAHEVDQQRWLGVTGNLGAIRNGKPTTTTFDNIRVVWT